MAKSLVFVVTICYASLISAAVQKVKLLYYLIIGHQLFITIHLGSVIEMMQSQNPELLWSVMFSPLEPNLVVTSGSKVGTLLHDIRFPNW